MCLFDTSGMIDEGQATTQGAVEAMEQASVSTGIITDEREVMTNEEPKSIVTGYFLHEMRISRLSYRILSYCILS